jgi:hypothetical protein
MVEALCDLVRSMNCYSNLIEGMTLTIEIEQALAEDYSQNKAARIFNTRPRRTSPLNAGLMRAP